MKTLIIALTTLSVLSPTQDFKNPVNLVDSDKTRLSGINVITSVESDVFVRVADTSVTYDELRYHAIYGCKNNKEPSIEIIDMLIQVEKSFNPPPEMRGMILAAACTESGYKPLAKGDRRFSRDKKSPMAIGILQLWPIYPGLDRKNPEQSAKAWMHHIVKKIPKVKRQCKYKKADKVWLAAWVTGIRYKKPNGRCNERPKHYRLLRKWHRVIKKERLKRDYCTNEDTCGC